MFVSLWVPPPVWLNCPSTTPIIIIYPPSYINTYKAVCLLVCGSPPPVWLNCPSPTPIIIIYHTLTTAILYQFALLQVVYMNSVSCCFYYFFEFVFYLSIKFSFWFCSLLNFLRLYGSYLRKVSFFHTSLGQIIYITYVNSISINFEPQYLEAKRT